MTCDQPGRAGHLCVIAEHDEWRVLWPDDIVDGPFESAEEATDFERQFEVTGRVQVRTVTTTATEWEDSE